MFFSLSLFLLLLDIDRQYVWGKPFFPVLNFCISSAGTLWCSSGTRASAHFNMGRGWLWFPYKNLLKAGGSSFISFTEGSMFYYKPSLEIGECSLWRRKIIRFGIARAFCLGGSGPAAHSLLKNGDIYQSIKGQSSKVNNSPKQGHLAPIN